MVNRAGEKCGGEWLIFMVREMEILRGVFAANGRLPGTVTIPPGDDMGGMMVGDVELLVGVDQVIDGVHFDLATTSIAKVGRKAVTRNLSDVAAMGAVPVGMVASAQLPRGFASADADALCEAMRVTGEQYGCALIGGDVAVVDGKLAISVTVFAKMDDVCGNNKPQTAGMAGKNTGEKVREKVGASGGRRGVLRGGAKVGDGVYVTGVLGGSLITWAGVTPHLDFEPRLGVGRRLAGHVHAMIDLSDGLATDLRHVCAMSGVGAQVWVDALPLRESVAGAVDGWQHALSDGEDYELCFCAEPETVTALIDDDGGIDGVRVTRIGTIVPASDDIALVHQDGTIEKLTAHGWEHRDG